MLFSETRKIVRSGSNDGLYTDQIDIQLQVMGSFEQRATGWAVAMEMRGRAASGITIGTVNFSDGYIVVEPPVDGTAHRHLHDESPGCVGQGELP